MSKHTPGPWVVAGPNLIDQADAGVWGSGEFGFVICDMQRDGYEDAEQEANAKLIAAAPAMYSLLAVRAGSGDNEARELIGRINNG